MMIHHVPILLLLTALLATASRAADSSTNAPAPAAPAPATGSTLESFRILSERNIFNQSRSPRSARRENSERRPAPVIHALSLVGTMIYEKGDFAFFDGTNPEFRKPVQPGDKIAGYVVKEVTPCCVTITNDAGKFEMKVGQQLRREGDGEWQLSTSTTRLTYSAGAAGQNGSPASEPAASEGGSSEDEALRRLMEKRAKELNQ